MKKILIVIPFFIPAYSYGGIVRVAYDHAIWLIQNGFDVTVITTDVFDAKNRISTQEEIIDGIKILRFRNVSNFLAKFHNLYTPLWMKKWIQENITKYDIIHIHDIYNLPTYWAGKYAKENKIKYFIQPHGTLDQIRIDSRKKGIKQIILKKLKNIFDNANGWFALTSKEKSDIQSATSNINIFSLPNGISLDKYKNIKKRDLHKEFWLPQSTIIFCFLWRIQYIKWLDISFKLLSEYNKKNSNWKLLIIWPDEGEKNKLIQFSEDLKIDEKIIWYWFEDTEKKYEYLASSNLFLLTSRSEWFPMTLLESLACNLPIFITNTCNLPEAHEKVGLVVEIDNIENAVDQLEYALKNEDIYKSQMQDFLENYNINNLISHLIRYYAV